jgi:hypothetical protein
MVVCDAWPFAMLGRFSMLLVHEAAVALPSYLNYFAVFDEDGDGALAGSEFAHALAGRRIGFYIVLDEVAALPLQPVAHFAGVGAARGAEEFKLGHG